MEGGVCLSFSTLRVGAWPKASEQDLPRPLGPPPSPAGGRCQPALLRGRSERAGAEVWTGGFESIPRAYHGDLGLVLPFGPFFSEPQFPHLPRGARQSAGHTELWIRDREVAPQKALRKWWLSGASQWGGDRHPLPTEHLLCAGSVVGVGDRPKSLPP